MRDLTGPSICALAGVLGASVVSFAAMLKAPGSTEIQMETVLTQGVSNATPRVNVLMPELRFSLDLCDIFATEIVEVPTTLADVESDVMQDQNEQTLDALEIESGLEMFSENVGASSLGLEF